MDVITIAKSVQLPKELIYWLYAGDLTQAQVEALHVKNGKPLPQTAYRRGKYWYLPKIEEAEHEHA